LRIGNLEVGPGETARGRMSFEAITDGQPLDIPIHVSRGDAGGPALWVNAAIHGDELEGTAGLWQVFDAVADQLLKGTLIGSLITNVSAYQAMRRTSPIDDLDVNRVFPGDPDGSFTRQFAHHYKQTVEGLATHYMDLHGGGNTHDVVFYTIYRNGHGEASRISRDMAMVAGSPIVWSSTDPWLDNGLFTLLTSQGIPSLIVEAGGEGRIRAKNVAAHAGSVLNVLKYLGMFAGSAPLGSIGIPVRTADFFFSHRGGIWISEHVAGDQVRRGDVIGRVQDNYGRTAEEVHCAAQRGVLLALRTYAAAPAGSNLGIVGVIED
jgi:uncharacterized protein